MASPYKTATGDLYTPELGTKIASLIAQNKTYKDIARELKISTDSIVNWLYKHEDLADKCTRAKPAQADSIGNEIAEVNRDLKDGIIAPDVARTLISSLQWLAKVKNPRIYGDKTILSNDPDNPISALALRLDAAIIKARPMIDVTPAYDDGSDLV